MEIIQFLLHSESSLYTYQSKKTYCIEFPSTVPISVVIRPAPQAVHKASPIVGLNDPAEHLWHFVATLFRASSHPAWHTGND